MEEPEMLKMDWIVPEADPPRAFMGLVGVACSLAAVGLGVGLATYVAVRHILERR